MGHAILCAGRLYCDVIFTGTPRMPTPGTEVFAKGVQLHAGGGAFITAATVAALGNPSAQYSVLPAPPFDQAVLAELRGCNVATSHCVLPHVSVDPQITVAMTCGSDRAFLTRAAGAALPPLGSGLPSGFTHLHIGELGTLEENPDLIRHARDGGMTISLDCGWQDSFDPAAFDLIAAVDVFLPNAREYEALQALGLSKDCAGDVVIKGGETGALASRKGQADWISAPTKPVPVIDATGAGDAFNGGFISEWLKGSTLLDCLKKGNACGAASVQAVGGAGGLAAIRDQILEKSLN